MSLALMRETTKRIGGWTLLAGGLTTFLASQYLNSTTGIFLFAIGVLLLLSDPILLLLDRRDSTLEGRWKTLYASWGLILASIVFFILRNQIHGDDDSSKAPIIGPRK